MGSLFRSEEVSLCQLFLQSEAAFNCVSELGELGLVQFRDLNPDVNAFQRKFVHELRRCDEMERKLRFVEKEIKKDEIPVADFGLMPEAPQPREMIDMEATFEKLEHELKEVITNSDALKKSYLELTELKHILKKAQGFFDEVEHHRRESMNQDDTNLIISNPDIARSVGTASQINLGFVAGVILRERLPMFERMMWRVCRGNVFIRTAEIETPLDDPVSGDSVLKTVFIVFFQGDQLKTRVRKICEGCRSTLYPCPETLEDRKEMVMGVVSRLEDLSLVLNQTADHRHRILVSTAGKIKNWMVKVRKIKAIYNALNMFNLDVTHKCFIAECWCPAVDMDRIQAALRRGTDRNGSSVQSILNRMDTKETPPTFNRVNKLTTGFQSLVDAYGVSNYREVNPAPYTIITFPFLFAVMFGDAGHGLIMFLFAFYLVWTEKKIIAMKSRNEVFLYFFNGRYMVLLMGLFSMYTGFMYNDVFAKSLNVFGSAWKANSNGSDYPSLVPLDPAKQMASSPYPFGVDPIWQASGNKILFLNSYKMKLSVVLGVSQMLFGVILSVWNHTYFRKPLNIVCEFIPQVIFLMAIFGYMNLMIISKWIVYTSKESGCAPSVLITLINMFMMKYTKAPEPPACSSLAPAYDGQQTVQTILVLLAVLCIPWMLCIKPYILYKQNQRKQILSASRSPLSESLPNGTSEPGNEQPAPNGKPMGQVEGDDAHDTKDEAAVEVEQEAEEEKDGFELGDVVIHQGIHTIEYCLGSVSHTASYLRLWALSLAHAQLSEVLWNMVMKVGLTAGGITGGIIMYPVFAFWAFLTVSILLLMEGLSAFLHALRLHWVEFQSKFYTGAGYSFSPFSFLLILEAAEADEN